MKGVSNTVPNEPKATQTKPHESTQYFARLHFRVLCTWTLDVLPCLGHDPPESGTEPKKKVHPGSTWIVPNSISCISPHVGSYTKVVCQQA